MVLGNFLYPSAESCRSAEKFFKEINPHFIVNNICDDSRWTAYAQYIDPVTLIGQCVLCESEKQAKELASRRERFGFRVVTYKLRRGDDAFVINLFEHRPKLQDLLSNNIYSQLSLAVEAQSWFIKIWRDWEGDRLPSELLQNIAEDYIYTMDNLGVSQNLKKGIAWENNPYCWHALGVALVTNCVNFLRVDLDIEKCTKRIDPTIFTESDSLRDIRSRYSDVADTLEQFDGEMRLLRVASLPDEFFFITQFLKSKGMPSDQNLFPESLSCEFCRWPISDFERIARLELNESLPRTKCFHCHP